MKKSVTASPRKYTALLLAICFVILSVVVSGCDKTDDRTENTAVKYSTVSDFTGATVCSQTGTMFDRILNGSIADLNHKYYDDISGMILALRNQDVDAISLDEPVARFVTAQNEDFEIFKDIIQTDSYGLPITKNSELTDQVSEVIAEYTADGTIDALKEKWFSGDAEKMHIPMEEYTGYDAPNGTIRFIHDSTQVPMAYVDDDGASAGYEVELVLKIGKRLGKKVVISQANFSALMMAVTTGTADIAAGSVSITDERRESVDFPASHYVGGIVLVCRKSDLSAGVHTDQSGGFLENCISSFEKNFIRENRWKLILSGIGVTLFISLSSLVFGTILGFAICAWRRSRHKFLSKFAAILIRFIQGIPVVVLLMVLYYLVFASSGIHAVWVAVIGFSINFGVNSAEIIRSGTESISRSQWETSACLGLGKVQTFSRVILPQTILNCLPAYKGEFINMMKMTSVVGYIAVSDVTRALDIIRSRTLEAFFPLVFNALIYVFFAWLLTSLIGLIEFKISPQKRVRKLEGKYDFKINETSSVTAELPEKGTELIRIEHLQKAYRASHFVLSDANAVINSGEVIAVIGASGCGKSTLLRMVGHLEKPTGGHIYINGKDTQIPKEWASERKKIGMVPQNFDLFPHLTVIENIMLAPVVVLKVPRQVAYNNAVELLKSVGLAEKLLHYPHELSGGQKQRVAIARTLAMAPQIILFDEPTSALDPASVSEVLRVIRSLAKKGYTMMIVTHEMQFAKDVATRVFYIDNGEIHESGTPEQIFDFPKKEHTRQFVHRLKILEEKIISREFDFIGINAKFEEYGQKYGLSKKTVNHIQVVFEELAVGLILPGLPLKVDMTVIVEYSEKSETVGMKLYYNGDRFDPTEHSDDLPMTLIRNASKDIYYGYHPDEELKNEIRLTVL